MRDKGVLESVGPTLGKEQPSTEQAPLVADDSVTMDALQWAWHRSSLSRAWVAEIVM